MPNSWPCCKNLLETPTCHTAHRFDYNENFHACERYSNGPPFSLCGTVARAVKPAVSRVVSTILPARDPAPPIGTPQVSPMPHSPVAAITDEFSPDLETAARAIASLGMTGAELRMVSGRNIIDLTDKEVDRAIAILRSCGLEIVSIASPVFKCVLPDAPQVDTRFQQDVFAAQHTFADQPRLARRAIDRFQTFRPGLRGAKSTSLT